MEVKINKEIRTYEENIFFGLSFRQFSCAIAAVVIAVVIYFAFKPVLKDEITSWLCIVFAAPIAVAGFFSYNGLTFEKFVLVYIKSEFLLTGKRVYKAENIYVKLLKERKAENDKIFKGITRLR